MLEEDTNKWKLFEKNHNFHITELWPSISYYILGTGTCLSLVVSFALFSLIKKTCETAFVYVKGQPIL